MEVQDYYEEEKKYPESVTKTLHAILCDEYSSLVGCMEDCQSPIEQMMALALNSTLASPYVKHRSICQNIEILEIRNQESVMASSGKMYIPDFTIPVLDIGTNNFKMFAIECDGHDFHEKTKEQVTRDRKRERELIEDGYTVIRFSGTEIYNDPFKCASQVFKIIFNYIRNKRKA